VIFVGVSVVLTQFFHVVQIGDSMEWKNGNTSISAGSQPAVLLWDVIAVALFAVLMLRKPGSVVEGVPTSKRRILAFLVDFQFSLCVTASVGALVPLLLEAMRTGHFAWYFHRSYPVKTDALAAVVSLVFMALMVFYFAFPLTRGRQTVGCFILRLRLAPPFGTEGCFTLKTALVRTYYAFTGGFTRWDRDIRGRTWYDRKTNCTVVLVDDD
jgi:RDD family